MSKTRSLPGGASGRVWSGAEVPGLELLVVDGEPWGSGATCAIGSGTLSVGEEAFRDAARRLGTPEPLTLAALSMLLLETGVAGLLPWSGPGSHGARAPMPEAGAAPPAIADGVLTYWRPHQQAANFVRVTIALDSLERTTELETTIIQEATAGNPLQQAREALQSDQLPVRQAAVRTLSADTSPAATALLLEAARDNASWAVRQAALRALSNRTLTTTDADLIGQILLGDAHDRVRSQAATTLCAVNGESITAVLEQAAVSDASARVKAAAQACLSKRP